MIPGQSCVISNVATPLGSPFTGGDPRPRLPARANFGDVEALADQTSPRRFDILRSIRNAPQVIFVVALRGGQRRGELHRHAADAEKDETHPPLRKALVEGESQAELPAVEIGRPIRIGGTNTG